MTVVGVAGATPLPRGGYLSAASTFSRAALTSILVALTRVSEGMAC